MYQTNVTVVGNLVTQVERRRLADGTTVVSFRVASTERRYDRAAEAWVDGATFYVPVTCWRRLAENVHASFVRGDPIIVHGRLHTREFDKDGQPRSVTEIEAAAVGPDLTRCTAVVTRTSRGAIAPVPATAEERSHAGPGPSAVGGDGVGCGGPGDAAGGEVGRDARSEVGVGAG